MLYGAEFFTGTEPFSQYPVGCEGCGIGAVHSSQDRVKTLTFGHLVGARWLSAHRTAGTSVTNHAGHTMVVVSQESACPHCTVVVAGGWLVR